MLYIARGFVATATLPLTSMHDSIPEELAISSGRVVAQFVLFSSCNFPHASQSKRILHEAQTTEASLVLFYIWTENIRVT